MNVFGSLDDIVSLVQKCQEEIHQHPLILCHMFRRSKTPVMQEICYFPNDLSNLICKYSNSYISLMEFKNKLKDHLSKCKDRIEWGEDLNEYTQRLIWCVESRKTHTLSNINQEMNQCRNIIKMLSNQLTKTKKNKKYEIKSYISMSEQQYMHLYQQIMPANKIYDHDYDYKQDINDDDQDAQKTNVNIVHVNKYDGLKNKFDTVKLGIDNVLICCHDTKNIHFRICSKNDKNVFFSHDQLCFVQDNNNNNKRDDNTQELIEKSGKEIVELMQDIEKYHNTLADQSDENNKLKSSLEYCIYSKLTSLSEASKSMQEMTDIIKLQLYNLKKIDNYKREKSKFGFNNQHNINVDLKSCYNCDCKFVYFFIIGIVLVIGVEMWLYFDNHDP